MALDQANRMISVNTPLGANELILTGFRGNEEISRLFRFQLDMISDNNAIAGADIVGKNVTFSVNRADNEPRFFNGFVSRFAAGDEDETKRRNYRAEVVPWVWFLTRTSDCRIFQQKTVPDIIEQIFGDLGFSDYKLQLAGSHPTRDYTVQYRETDFNFISRLAEEEGIFWFFEHEDGKHTLILTDHKGGYFDCVENKVEYPHDFGSRAMLDHITSWEHRYEFRTGKIAQTDFNFETPSTSLMTNSNTVMKIPGTDNYEFYDYPGIYGVKGDGSGLTDIRMEEEEAEHDVVQATSLCKTFSPGGKFVISKHRSGSEEGKGFVITSIQHSAVEPLAYDTSGQGLDYRNSFSCIPDSVVFRPPRVTPKPFVQGVQTAIVVGPGGEEIFPDEYGRVKVQFHWDREGKYDEKSSCWVRVSQVHAGKGFGGIDIPRIGEEVIVDFVEGDPDRPIITGRVYHAENMPPFGLPGGKNISGLKSNSTKGGGGYNEFVLDDTKGNELIREHGQFDKDSTIENDLREHVLNDRSRDVTNNETIQIGVDRSETVGNDESLSVGNDRKEDVGNNETLSVGSNRTRTVGKNETVTVALMRTHTVGINEAITVGAAREVTVGGLQAITVGAVQTITVGASQTITVGASEKISVAAGRTISVGANLDESVGGNHTEKVGKSLKCEVGADAGFDIAKNYSVGAGDQIVLKTGSSELIMKKDGTIQLKGKDINIEGSGKIVVKASSKLTLKGSQIAAN